MKRTILTFALAIATVFASARQKTVEAYRFTYEFRDSNSIASLGYPDLMRLDVLPDGQSSFASEYYLEMKEKTRGATETNFAAALAAVTTGRKGKSYTILKNFPKSGEMTYLDAIGVNHYKIPEQMDEIAWTLGEEVKEVCGYRCRKAEADVRGRHWTAWYAEELPMNNGPWKLYGLPGLILEAHDADNFFHFTCIGIQKAATEPTRKLDKKYMKCTNEEYFRQLHQLYSDRVGFLGAQMAAEGKYFKALDKNGNEKKHSEPEKHIYIEKTDGDEQ